MVDVTFVESAGSVWSASRVLTQLGATGDVVRAVNTGHRRTSRPRWTLTRHWLDPVPAPWDAVAGYRELVRRWLHTVGPGTEADLVCWFGASKAVVRTALTELDAEAARLTAWLDGVRVGTVYPSPAMKAAPRAHPDPTEE